MAMIEASVIVLTYRRPEFLSRTLASCFAQTGVAEEWEILVVDNDPAQSAQAAVMAMGDGSPVPLRYLSEARRGISHARNTGVAAAAGRFVLFLDDDEEANPGWLAAFLATMRQSAADIAVGPVLPRFPVPSGTVNPYAIRVFTRDARVPSGTPLAQWGGIGNSILLKERCFAGPQPFDPRLGLSGGEDVVFLGQLARRGWRMVWCAEAGVEEAIPAGRLAPSYLLRRAFRAGQTTTFLHAAVAPPEPGAAAGWMAVGCAQVAIYLPLGLVLRIANHPRWLAVAGKAASGLGKVLWHPRLHLPLYRQARAPA